VLVLVIAHPGYAAGVRDAEIQILSARLFPAVTAMAVSLPYADSAEGGGLTEMLLIRRRRMADCDNAAPCLFSAAAWTTQEREFLAKALEREFKARPPQNLPVPDDGVRAQVLRELEGLNHILRVYGLGQAPPHPQIDGPDDAFGSPQFERHATDAVALGEAARADPVAALDSSVVLALSLLDANDRDDAAAFEPLDARYNALAVARARTIDWSRYSYTAIIVPGIGPDDLVTALSARGKLNVRMAAARFFDGVAPYIILTGGAVHPRDTRHVEALEMRQALIERYGVPANGIVVEPYARHTTTNLRNATRRLIDLGAPLDRDALIITNPEQSQYIQGAEFAARNQQELGYQPGAIGGRMAPAELTFRPARASLRIDPMDPLDP
jgi:hypothetical protein